MNFDKSGAKSYQNREASRAPSSKAGTERSKRSKQRKDAPIRKLAAATGLPQAAAAELGLQAFLEDQRRGTGNPKSLARTLARLLFDCGEIKVTPGSDELVSLRGLWADVIREADQINQEIVRRLVEAPECELVFQEAFAGMVHGEAEAIFPEPDVVRVQGESKRFLRFKNGDYVEMPKDWEGMNPMLLDPGFVFRGKVVREASLRFLCVTLTERFRYHLRQVLVWPIYKQERILRRSNTETKQRKRKNSQ